ncbi:TPA: hypothetical protein DEQ22_02735 [Candidatus Nomurabacteria bacterium]|uniref:Phosphatidic acid phosphatase type 2/haloperoxidase domain-containing protein n=2 Tax=Candidatus Nomuraibacteriota TaxID=1752729 RepID=A0A1F6YP20_9BACT|nr:MAG: PAP2 superfamily protein [Parcubacteria group bacterium GW2011_GWC1_42_21]KKS57672.1 MAG: PAP2 superfamily protein [Candidatus Nomurabacteria bacterium GW2011_GWF1_42_40]KKS99832.1 MAG: PAP2 superfamily protein [Candidatus Nomurabacteria bacterium GW2011_GWA1_43_17]KKT07493.1 MAG: PAP2 superfamily protein [Candidatus Nomurabacteria bacterium GW2011_GWB1_43_19]KKT11306.1 MAG: PAP2 superfamily protein [Candidatus Nomurabacteria bacterium GW2011_GWF2_43_24]KKT17884.1 MAG: PAP2 superfamily
MNNAIFYFFYNLAHQSATVDWLIVFAAAYFPFVVAILAFWYLLFYRKSLRGFVLVFLTAGIAAVISKFLKIFIHASRPEFILPDVQALFAKTSYAFPSDHATFFMALAFAIFFLHKKAGYVFMIFAFLIGLGRIAAGVHFPIDILGGFILGALVAYFVKNI